MTRPVRDAMGAEVGPKLGQRGTGRGGPDQAGGAPGGKASQSLKNRHELPGTGVDPMAWVF